MKKLFFPFGVWAMRQLDLTAYDVILQSTTHCAKYIKTRSDALIITYCHTPFRLVWRSETYEQVRNASFLKRIAFQYVINRLRKIDLKSARRTDWFVTNSSEVVPRIEQAYHPKQPISVINPSVKCKNFYVDENPEDYFLVVSRFEPYKKVDLVIEAFNQMPDKKLLIVGKGTKENELRSMAGPNIQFLKSLSADALATVFARCKALIFPQLEDYGITPLEASASGRPVIAYGSGGVLDTMIPVSDISSAERSTALFFNTQTTEAIIHAVSIFDNFAFNSAFIRKHAESFDEEQFVMKIKKFVIEKHKEHCEAKVFDFVN
jgi:glycosyltransferase involved in cell wall biosynthesis